MRAGLISFCTIAALLLNGAADAQTIGLAAPLSGANALLGTQMRDGAQAAADLAGQNMVIVDDLCTAEGGLAAAQRLQAAQVRVVVGFLCTEAIEAALPVLTAAGIPVITPGVRTNSLTDRREKTRWLVFRTGPRADDEARATADILVRRWREALFAIVDDGTIYGRELAEAFRNAAEAAKLAPVVTDTFRPQSENQIGLLGRLKRAGATHLLAAGDRDDIAVMTRDAAQLGYPLVIAGGENLRSAPGAVPLAPGTLMIGLPEWAEIAEPAVTDQLRVRNVVAEGYVLPAYAATQIALASVDASSPVTTLSGTTFATGIGNIAFDAKGDLTQNPYRLFSFNGSAFVPVAN